MHGLAITKHRKESEMAMENVPPGYRFYPTEEELVHFYLRHKVEGSRQNLLQTIDRLIKTLDIYDFNPWELPQLSGDASSRDLEQWFFFVPKQESEIRGGRPRRLTASGYWKATGSPGSVYSSHNHVIGVRRTMVFYTGRAPKGMKTKWKMNEYKLDDGELASLVLPNQLRDVYSLCRVYKKSKCLRVFDRRPTVDHASKVDKPSHKCDQQSMNSSSSAMVVERVVNGSPEYSNSTSSSVDDDRQSRVSSSRDHHQSNSSSVILNNDSLWDWEQLQWF